MLLFRHHTYSDVIDFDPKTDTWRPIDDNDRPPVSALSIAYRSEYPICGSYTIEDGHRYAMFWDSSKKFLFNYDTGKTIEMFQKNKDGSISALIDKLSVKISASKFSDGRIRQKFSEIKILAQSSTLFETSYSSSTYLMMYQANTTSSAGFEDLSDWDFFVGLEKTIEDLNEKARTGRIELEIDANNKANVLGVKIAAEDLIYTESEGLCTRTGVWVQLDDLRQSIKLNSGDRLPKVSGQTVTWVWARTQ